MLNPYIMTPPGRFWSFRKLLQVQHTFSTLFATILVIQTAIETCGNGSVRRVRNRRTLAVLLAAGDAPDWWWILLLCVTCVATGHWIFVGNVGSWYLPRFLIAWMFQV